MSFGRLSIALLIAAGLATGQYRQRYPSGRSSAPQMGIPDEPPGNFAGLIEEADKSKLRIDLGDGKSLVFHCSGKTEVWSADKRMKLTDLRPGQHVTIDGRHARDGSLDAIKIRIDAQADSPQLQHREPR